MEDNTPKRIDYDSLTADKPLTETVPYQAMNRVEARARNRALARGALLACGTKIPEPAVVPGVDPDEVDAKVVQEAETKAEQEAEAKHRESLLGPNVDMFPAMIPIGENEKGGTNVVQLGYVVAKAHEVSGLTVDEWNALAEVGRDLKTAAMIEQLKACNGEIELVEPET